MSALLLVGLGNPGPKYAGHRHNVGFMAVDALGDLHGFAPERSKFQGRLREGRLGAEKTLILKPETFMNESGRAVGEAVRFFKLTPEDVVVFYDELDLAPGKVRVKKGGGHAGHNGVRAIHAHIGPDYRRVRIGIGHPGAKEKVTGHVLGDFSKAEQVWLPDLLDALARAAPFLVEGDDARYQTEVARLAPLSGRSPTRAPHDPKETQEPSGEASAAPGSNEEPGRKTPGPFGALGELLKRRD